MVFFLCELNAQKHDQNYVEFSWSNDLWYFPNPSDKHFTNGMYADISINELNLNLLDPTFLNLGPSTQRTYGIAITQNMYTPENIETAELLLTDRPFASYLTAHLYKLSLANDSGKKLRTEWQLGVLGRAAGGGATQNFIHSFLPTSDEVPGWVNEVRTDLIVNYNISVESRVHRLPFLETWVSLDLRLGSLYSDFTGGMNFQLGLFDSRFENLREWKASKKFRASLVGGAKLRMIAYDATVSGGLFRPDSRFRNVYDQNNSQLQFNLGYLITYGKVAMEFTLFHNSPDIKGGKAHSWGSLSFQYQF